MKMQINKAFIVSIIVIGIAYYINPLVLVELFGHFYIITPEPLLLIVNAIVIFAMSIYYSYQNGFHILFAVIVALCFIPSIFIFFASSMKYLFILCIFYFAAGMAGQGIGNNMRTKISK